MKHFKQVFRDREYVTGLMILFASAAMLLIPVGGRDDNSTMGSPLFVLVFAAAIIYFVVLAGSGRLRKGRDGLHPLMLLLMTGLVSAFLLNRGMFVFEPSTPWFSVLLVVCCLNYLLFNFFPLLPRWLRYLVLFGSGISLACFLYLGLYQMPLYLLSAVVVPALGLSLHTFLPAVICVYTIVLVVRTTRQFPGHIPAFWFGLAAAVITVAIYCISWRNAQVNLENNYDSKSHNAALPGWLMLARETEPGSIQEKILQSEINFDIPGEMNFMFSSRRSEYLKHDPLVMMAAFFSPKLSIPVEDREKIIRSMYGEGHVFEDRLWSGFGLATDSVTTTAELWPSFRLSYTDMLINVKVQEETWWSTQREGIYTFQLPEGSVVTSLSLWIDGVEQKGVLTSKGKADSAYRTIVGVQRRDPSVVHWMEGNRVSVRVFPIVPGAGRKFRIGVTSPLKESTDGITYERIRFDGPDHSLAREQVNIVVHGDKPLVDYGSNFAMQKPGRYVAKKGFDADWQVGMKTEALAAGGFAFNGNNYQLVKAEKTFARFAPSAIYLDLNNSWQRSEFDHVLQAAGNKPVYTFTDGQTLVTVDKSNADEMFEVSKKIRFSVFPFYGIKDPESALVIGKSTDVSPDLGTLKGTVFMEKTADYFSGGHTIRYFSLTDSFSPYLRSLREFRVVQSDSGPLEELLKLLARSEFAARNESADRILFNNGQYAVERGKQEFASAAPDHLLRLFAYNDILARSGRRVLSKDVEDGYSVQEASEANIVSPFSSLIVLETQADYDRFNIQQSKDSLGNASVKSTGSVPEPHEWALIVLGLLLILYMRFKPALSIVKK